MADVSYLKESLGSQCFNNDRLRIFAKVDLTDTIGKDIRGFLEGKKLRCLGVPLDEGWVVDAAKYFGGALFLHLFSRRNCVVFMACSLKIV